MAWQHVSDEILERYYLGMVTDDSDPFRSTYWHAPHASSALKRHRITWTRCARRLSKAATTWNSDAQPGWLALLLTHVAVWRGCLTGLMHDCGSIRIS
jgi:hypothetical protein